MSTAPTQLEPTVLAGNGQEFSAMQAGPASGELVMLLHGFPEGSYSWRHQVDALAGAGFRVLAPDLRGYGFSSKPADVSAYAIPELARDVLAMAESVGQERMNLVGHDWGAVLTWYLAQEFPARVRRGVVINGPHPATVLSHALLNPTQFVKGSYVGFFQLPLVPEATLRANGFAVLRQAMCASAREGTFSDEDLDRFQAGWDVDGALTAMLNWYRALVLSPAAIAASKIRVPMCVLWGDKDAALDAQLADAGAALCSSVELHHFPDASHWLHEEEPEAVNAILLEMLSRSETIDPA
ncbi:alpha/beta hydrolase [Ramlibacter sp. AN1015]|uniref:alpha/beta fold hydrolase n=1 Tax=Ramlibacter sp. AN1015 TaxID=3133428 RepID=UPI0030BD0CFE